MTAAEMRAWRGPALFSYGFRPFFLFGSLWAALAAPLWVVVYVVAAPGFAAVNRDWHVHEMLFGYLGAVIAGFLLTSVPNWTGRLPVTGAPLASLAYLWLAGRAAMLLTPWIGAVTAALFDLAFLPTLAAVLAREIIAGRNWRNLPVCALVGGLALANLGFHLRPVWPALGDLAERLALAAPAMLLGLIGGRVTPSFTLNWLRQRRAREPAPFGWIDSAALAATAVALGVWVVAPWSAAAGALLCAAGLALAMRLARWRGAAAWREPLVWILHAGYAWLAIGLFLIGASALLDDPAARTGGIHALAVGAFGVMTLAVMTRASLGHTGRVRTADAATLAIYLAVNAAAVLRVAAAFEFSAQALLLATAAVCWTGAFLGFAIAYGPMLVRPRAG